MERRTFLTALLAMPALSNAKFGLPTESPDEPAHRGSGIPDVKSLPSYNPGQVVIVPVVHGGGRDYSVRSIFEQSKGRFGVGELYFGVKGLTIRTKDREAFISHSNSKMQVTKAKQKKRRMEGDRLGPMTKEGFVSNFQHDLFQIFEISEQIAKAKEQDPALKYVYLEALNFISVDKKFERVSDYIRHVAEMLRSIAVKEKVVILAGAFVVSV